jgi:hypothetical protein
MRVGVKLYFPDFWRSVQNIVLGKDQLDLDDVRQGQLTFLFEQRKLFDHVIARLSFLHIPVTPRARGRRDHALVLCLYVAKGFLLKKEFDFQI